VPCMPVVTEPFVEPVGAPAAVLFGDEVLLGAAVCASAVPESASASASVMNFICFPLMIQDKPAPLYDVPTNSLFLQRGERLIINTR
jgi:hypothetical protein